MEYHEFAPPDSLRHVARAGWTLTVPQQADWVIHVATPDGCMEIIRRCGGRSEWNGEQPACFVAGMISRPTELRLSGGSSFIALRVWPWTWRAISGRSPADLIDRWAALADEAPSFASPAGPSDVFAAISRIRLAPRSDEVARAILQSSSSGELVARTGMSARTLQRWFSRHVGVAPRTYFRLLRFSEAFAELPEAGSTLAEHAIDHGFADQAHMAREFRSLAGTPAGRIKVRGKGPFLSDG